MELIEFRKEDLNGGHGAMGKYAIKPWTSKMKEAAYRQSSNTVEVPLGKTDASGIPVYDNEEDEKKGFEERDVSFHILEGFTPAKDAWDEIGGSLHFTGEILYHPFSIVERMSKRVVGGFHAPLLKVVEVKKALNSIKYSRPINFHDENENPLDPKWNLQVMESMFYIRRLMDMILSNYETNSGNTQNILIGENMTVWKDKTNMAFAPDLPRAMAEQLGLDPDEEI